MFQDDIYPDCVSGEAAQDAASWCSNNDVEPNRIDMRTLFTGKNKKDTTSSSGGLKKGGLKGLKAKKDAKKADASPAPAPVADSPEVTLSKISIFP